MDIDYKKHWDNVFQKKDTSKVSWYQTVPQLSIDLISQNSDSLLDSIIDIGGGDSRLPDSLLSLGYKNIAVLDISQQALTLSKIRLAEKSDQINWIANDIMDLDNSELYDIWHDRAVFHFLTEEKEQHQYKLKLLSHLTQNGRVIIGAFSKNEGPFKCSGLDVSQQSRESIGRLFYPEFDVLRDFEEKHKTYSGIDQNFYWVILKRN